MGRRKKKSKTRRSFRDKWSERIADARQLSSTLVNNPRDFPRAAEGIFKRFLRRLWGVHGGGLYSLGFIVTFLWLELRMLFGDIADAEGVGDFVSQQLLEYVFRFTFESLGNTIQALIWPLFVIQLQPPIGIIALALAFAAFPYTLEKPIEMWLFGEEVPNKLPGAPEDDERTQ